MQTYPLKLTAAASQAMFPTTADLFVYESGNGAGETRILVKPDSGGEIALRPGQRFRLPPGEKASQWLVRAYTAGSAIDGSIVIGSGEFDDANTNNIVTLAEGFSNNVRVNNTTAERIPVALDLATRVPVALDPASRVPVSLDPNQFLQIAPTDTTVTYQSSFSDVSATTGAIQIVAPATNTNGLVVEYAQFALSAVGGGSGNLSLLAKASAPASVVDGDVLLTACVTSNASFPGMTNEKTSRRVRVPPGKGLWIYQGASSNPAMQKTVLYTLQAP